MHNNKLLKLIDQLPAKEVKELWKYVRKQYDSTDLIYRLTEYLTKQHPNFQSKTLKDRIVFRALLPNETFDRIRLQNIFSRTGTAVKKFLWWRGFDLSPIETNFFLLKLYKRHGMDSHFEKQLKELNRLLEKKTEKSIWQDLHKMMVAHEHYYYMGTEEISNSSKQIFHAMNHLDDFYAGTKLKYASELQNRKNLLNEDIDEITFLPKIQERDFSEEPTFFHYCFQVALKMIEERDDAQYFILKEIHFNSYEKLEQEDQHILTSYLLNHASFRIRNGNNNFIQESFDLFKNAVEKKMFISNNRFNHHHVVNIIDVSCRLKKYKWAKQFISTIENQLAPSLKESYIAYCKAFIEFSQGRPKACYQLLEHTKSVDPFFELRVRWLDIVSRFEQDKHDEILMHLIKSLERFIKKENRFTKAYQENALLSLKIVRTLINPNANKEQLKKLFNQTKGYYYQKWIEKVLNT